MLALIVPILAWGQQRAPQGLTFYGVPFGIPTEEFQQKVDSKKVNGEISSWGFNSIHYNVNVYLSADLAYSVEVRFGSKDKYKGGFAENIMLASLCAKFGEFKEYRNRENEIRKIWFLKNGLVTMSYSTYGDNTSYVVTIIDYASLKKVGKTIQDIL